MVFLIEIPLQTGRKQNTFFKNPPTPVGAEPQSSDI